MRSSGSHLNDMRRRHPTLGDSPRDALFGYFSVEVNKVRLDVISSGPAIGFGGDAAWEHVSVSTPTRCPTWDEMCFVKNLFWGSHVTVLQFHPEASRYVNKHPHCLHLWRKVGVVHELPPGIFV